MFIVVNSLKQLQILVTKLTSFSDPIMQIILTYMCLNRTLGTGVLWDFFWLCIYWQWKILVRLFEINMVEIQFPVTCRHHFAFHKSELGGPSGIWVQLVTQPYVYRATCLSEGLLKVSTIIFIYLFCHQQKYFSSNLIFMYWS